MIDVAATIDRQPRVLHDDGTVSAWGDDYFGLVSGAAAVTDAVAIAGGHYFALALQDTGEVTAWGRDQSGVVTGAAAISGAVAIDAGAAHAMALLQDGSVVVWGDDSQGQVTNTPALTDVVEIAAGGYACAALRADGALVVWGDDSHQQVSGAAGAPPALAISLGDASGALVMGPCGIDLCDPDPCNGHGSCDPTDGLCNCAAGYDGAACDACDAGYWGYPSCQLCDCDDGDLCNGVESCDAATGCLPGTPLVCDDGDLCNGAEICDAALGCQAGTPLVCDDGDVCNGAESCDAATGCQAGTPLVCDDGDLCNGAESCDAALGCQAGTPLVCDDGNVCDGLDTCDPVTGCNDGIPLACSDGDSCTTDTCDPVEGCVFTPIGGCTGGGGCVEAVASVTITSPYNAQIFPLGYDEWVPEDSGDVTLSFDYAEASPSDTLLIQVDDEAPVPIALAADHELTALADGAHTVAVQIADASGTPYCAARDGVRFYLSRVCLDDSHCEDDDPCSLGQCIRDPSLVGWTGRCRFGPDTEDPDCCVNELWCDAAGFSFGEAGLSYTCADIDADGVGDCVQCVADSDCWLTNVCQLGASCVDHECVYVDDPDCCLDDFDCDDGVACTTDSCDVATNTCLFAPIDGCCIAGQEDELPGADSYGCTAADAHPCLRFVCIGQGAEAECRHAQLWNQCCADDTDCDQARLLTACVDPTGQGYARCATETPTGVDGAFYCDYGPVDEDCCTHDWQCAEGYPAQLGTCTGDAGDYRTCEYAANPDYCASPVATIVISEIMVNTPELGDPAGEWIELFNPTALDIDIEGWTVRQDEAGTEMVTIDTLADSLVVPAGGFVTLAASSAPEINGGLEPDYVYDAAVFHLDDTDAVLLYDDLGGLQDEVSWDLWLLWGNSASMALVHPYLDNNTAGSWARSALAYGEQTGVISLGTPGKPNRDVFDPSLTNGLECDDGVACTLDLCNLDKGALCAHLPLFDCCTAADGSECNDYSVCTEDSCDVATNRCQHLEDPACCLTDEDCLGVYPDEFDTVAEQTAFDLCTESICVGGQCRFGRDRTNPGCCVTTDAGLGLGCSDRNSCTTDLCADEGAGYPQCTYDRDPLDDPDLPDGDECCFTSADCDDGDASTIDVCARVDFAADDEDCPGVLQSQCCHRVNPLYCAGDTDCDDGLACTDDACIDDGCVFTPVAGAESCCESHAQCSDGDACEAAPIRWTSNIRRKRGMEMSMDKKKRRRRSFTREFKAEVVDLCLQGDRSMGQIARELDLTESAVRAWVRQSRVDKGDGPPGALTSAEKEEIRRLRREVRQLREEREILKKAAAFFAKEST